MSTITLNSKVEKFIEKIERMFLQYTAVLPSDFVEKVLYLKDNNECKLLFYSFHAH